MSDYGGRHFVNLVTLPKSKKHLFTGFGLCFALENKPSLLHYIKRMHIGHLLTLFCILKAVILIFVIVRL